jgi:hypothetical protein
MIIYQGEKMPRAALQKVFDEVTSGKHALSKEWFSPVPALDRARV